MKICRYLYKSEKRLRFVRLVKHEADFNELMAMANAVFTALWPVVRPLSVKLEMAARSPREFPIIDDEIPVPVRDWHLYEVYVPAHVTTIGKWAELRGMDPSHYSEEAIPELTLQTLADWLARAHTQQLPEGYVPVLATLDIHHTRARLLEDQGPYAKLVWEGALGTFIIPVEKRENGLWVSGPRRDTLAKAPIDITFWTLHGRLTLDIWVYWSLWIKAGSAEAELLRTCLLELEKQGWEGEKEATDWLRRT
jgi:hypothetical protein